MPQQQAAVPAGYPTNEQCKLLKPRWLLY
jgi:hypothetical protein